MDNNLKTVYDWQALLAHRLHELSAVRSEADKIDHYFFEEVGDLYTDLHNVTAMMCNRAHRLKQRAVRIIEKEKMEKLATTTEVPK